MKNNKQRIEWIDICKCLGILLVVLGHVLVPKTTDIWIHSFHMPLFFILAGMCFNEIKHTKFSKFLLSRFKTLIIPYLIFSIVLYYIWIAILSLTNGDGIRGFSNLTSCMLNSARDTSCYGAVNWFLPALFISEILFFLVGKLCKYNKIKISIFMVIIFVIAFVYPKITTYRIPLAFDSAIMGLGFYSLGWLIKNINYNKIKELMSKHLVLSIMIIALALFLTHSIVIINKMTNMRTLVYGNYSLYLLNAISLSVIFIVLSIYLDILSKKIRIINLLKIVGKHTLAILLFNPIFARLYLLLIDGHVSINNNILLVINNIFVSIIIIVLCVLLSILINKYLPFLFGKKKNN